MTNYFLIDFLDAAIYGDFVKAKYSDQNITYLIGSKLVLSTMMHKEKN